MRGIYFERAVKVLERALTVILFAFALQHSVFAGEVKTVIVGYYPEPGMMNGAEPGVMKSGYAYEYLQEMASRAGWRYKYVYGRFDELYPKLKSGEIDVLPYVNYSEARTKEILFPDREMGAERFYLASRKMGVIGDDLGRLAGKRIGTSRGSFDRIPFVALMKEHNLDFELVEYDTVYPRWEALLKGDIDYSIETGSMRQRDDVYAVYAIPGEYPYHLAVAPGRGDILAELNAAQNELQQDNPGFLHDLQFRYFSGVPIFKMLSPAAENWLKDHDVIRIGSYNNQKPFAYRDKNGKIVGIAADCIALMLKELGVETRIEWVLFDGRESALQMLKKGEVDLIFPYYRNRSDAERDGVVVSSTVFDAPFGVLYHGNYDENTLSVIASLGTRLGTRFVRDEYPQSECIACRTGQECVQKVLSGEATCAVMYLPILQLVAAEFNEDLKIKTLYSRCDVCFAALPGNASLVGLVNKVIPYVGREKVCEIENRHAIATSVRISGWQFFRRNPVYIYGALIVLMTLAFAFVVIMMRARRDRELREIVEQANRAKSEFLFNMSHDVRTPMHAIMGFVDIAVQGLDDRANVKDCLEKIRKSGDLLYSLLNSILDIGRIEVGKAKLVEAPGDVMLSFESVQTTMTEIAKEKDISLTFEFGEIVDRYVWVDYEKISRVFMNILTNAVKYTNEGGRVRVRCEQVGEREGIRPGDQAKGGGEVGVKSGSGSGSSNFALYRYTFEDNGIGMAPEFLKKLYDRFSREQTTTMSGVSGIGLGMSICKAFVDILGGRIECRSKKGEGTTFIVTVPLRRQNKGEEAYIDPETGVLRHVGSAVTNTAPSFRGQRVLLVDDSKLNREVSRHYLTKAGLEVETAVNGSDAVKKVATGVYDIIFMDVQMPVMDGYEASRAIRAAGIKTPIIAWSANAFEEDRAKAIAAGMNDHIAKGVKAAVLMETISRYIGDQRVEKLKG